MASITPCICESVGSELPDLSGPVPCRVDLTLLELAAVFIIVRIELVHQTVLYVGGTRYSLGHAGSQSRTVLRPQCVEAPRSFGLALAAMAKPEEVTDLMRKDAGATVLLNACLAHPDPPGAAQGRLIVPPSQLFVLPAEARSNTETRKACDLPPHVEVQATEFHALRAALDRSCVVIAEQRQEHGLEARIRLRDISTGRILFEFRAQCVRAGSQAHEYELDALRTPDAVELAAGLEAALQTGLG